MHTLFPSLWRLTTGRRKFAADYSFGGRKGLQIKRVCIF